MIKLNPKKADRNCLSITPVAIPANFHPQRQFSVGVHKNKLAKRTNRRIEKQRAINDYR